MLKILKTGLILVLLMLSSHVAFARYLQADPVGLEGGSNRFGYVDGNALNYVDPDGLTKNDPKGGAANAPILNPPVNTLYGGRPRQNFNNPNNLITPIPLLGGGRSAAGMAQSRAVLPPVPLAGGGGVSGPTCPPEVKNTLARINAGQAFPHRNDGSVFQNKEGLLPVKPGGYYREWVHPTTGVTGPGAQRVVTGQGGEIYYTPDHYRTFIPVSP